MRLEVPGQAVDTCGQERDLTSENWYAPERAGNRRNDLRFVRFESHVLVYSLLSCFAFQKTRDYTCAVRASARPTAFPSLRRNQPQRESAKPSARNSARPTKPSGPYALQRPLPAAARVSFNATAAISISSSRSIASWPARHRPRARSRPARLPFERLEGNCCLLLRTTDRNASRCEDAHRTPEHDRYPRPEFEM